MKKLSFLLIGLACLFTSCNSTNNPSDSSNSVSTPSTSDERSDSSNSSTSESIFNSSSSSEVIEDEYHVLPDWEETEVDISLGGDLLDIAVNRAFITGKDYSASFTLQPAEYNQCRIISSNDKVIKIEKGEGSKFTIFALHAGQAYLRIYDSLGDVRYCRKVVVRDIIPLEDMEEHLVYECEVWKSVFYVQDQYLLTFNEGGVYTITGIDPMSTSHFSNTGTYEYVGLSTDGREYCYKFTDQDIAVYSLVGFNIAINGSFMYLMARTWTETIMLPSTPTNEEK